MEKKEKNLNPNKNKNKKKMEFELCKVCNLNHDQGRRHNYFPNHIKSLSSFLSRFLKKLSDVRFFLKNPTLLRPEHASRNRLWCVFCDSDIEELDSLFVCNNAIRHLASLEHLKNLKNFLWKYGGGMDHVDSFRISESDLVQWENKCKALKNATTSSSGRSDGPHLGDLKDIHDTFNSDKLDNFKRNAIPSFELSILNGFIPLQKFTNEKIQVYHPKVFEVANIVPRPHETSFPVITHSNMDLHGMHAEENIAKDLTVYRDNQQSLSGNCQTSSIGWSPIGEVGRPCNGGSSNHVLQALTQITPVLSEESRANVHSGAPPPWFEKTEETQLNGQLHTENNRNVSRKSGKSQKLNPNRVGAAWAEKRKIELEMEKPGETINNNCDANWLPNFGRVWQSGSRKESRKEFETENEKSLKTQILSEKSMIIQPYVSKRKRRGSDDSKD